MCIDDPEMSPKAVPPFFPAHCLPAPNPPAILRPKWAKETIEFPIV
jgi:hypothetical protein